MKYFICPVLLCAVLLVCGCHSSSNVGAELQELDSVAVVVKGNAQFRTHDGNWSKVKTGMRLKAGCEIQTANDSYVDLQFRSRFAPVLNSQRNLYPLSYRSRLIRFDAVRIMDNSVLEIVHVDGRVGRFTKVENVRLKLESGRVFCSTRNLTPHPNYEVSFINVIVRVTVGQFLVDSSGKVAVVSGRAIVETEGRPDYQELLPLQQFDCVTGTLTVISDFIVE